MLIVEIFVCYKCFISLITIFRVVCYIHCCTIAGYINCKNWELSQPEWRLSDVRLYIIISRDFCACCELIITIYTVCQTVECGSHYAIKIKLVAYGHLLVGKCIVLKCLKRAVWFCPIIISSPSGRRWLFYVLVFVLQTIFHRTACKSCFQHGLK